MVHGNYIQRHRTAPGRLTRVPQTQLFNIEHRDEPQMERESHRSSAELQYSSAPAAPSTTARLETDHTLDLPLALASKEPPPRDTLHNFIISNPRPAQQHIDRSPPPSYSASSHPLPNYRDLRDNIQQNDFLAESRSVTENNGTNSSRIGRTVENISRQIRDATSNLFHRIFPRSNRRSGTEQSSTFYVDPHSDWLQSAYHEGAYRPQFYPPPYQELPDSFIMRF